MNVSGQKQLYMGETDYPTSGTIRYYEQDGKSYVVQCNDRMRTIAVYDYTTGKKVGKKMSAGYCQEVNCLPITVTRSFRQ